MPTVKAYGQRQVGTAARPTARRQNAAETFESAGGDVARAQAGFGNVVARVGAELIQQERDRADRVANLSTLRRLNDLDHSILRDPQKGMLNKRGLEVMQGRDAALAEFDKVAGAIGAELRTDRQREFFQQHLVARRDAVRGAIDVHGSRELRAYQGQEAQATLGSVVNAALADAEDLPRIASSLQQAERIIEEHADALGLLGPEARKAAIAKVRSEIHVGVIEQLLGKEQEAKARDYFEEMNERKEIAGDKIAALEKALDEGTLRGQSQKEADAIIAAGGKLTEWREKARAIKDPKVRDLVMQRVEHEGVMQDRAEAQDLQDLTLRAYNAIDAKGTLTAISPADWVKLPGPTKASMRSYLDQKLRGVPIKTDLPTYYGLMRQAADDPTAFADVNLLNFKHQVDEGELKQLAGLQLSIKNGDRRAADQALDGFRTNHQVAVDTLKLAGINTADTKEARDAGDHLRVARFMQKLDERVQALQSSTGKKASNQDVQALADALLESVTIEKPGWWFWQKGTEKRVVDLTIGDIPATERKLIEETLRKRQQPADDAEILKLYLDTQRRHGLVK